MCFSSALADEVFLLYNNAFVAIVVKSEASPPSVGVEDRTHLHVFRNDNQQNVTPVLYCFSREWQVMGVPGCPPLEHVRLFRKTAFGLVAYSDSVSKE